MEWQLELISVYLAICKIYQRSLHNLISRISNHVDLRFSDEEVMTIYIVGILHGRYEIKDIYQYTDRHLRCWFPHLPSYVAFVQRLNRISHLFETLVSELQRQFPQKLYNPNFARVMDSMPIIKFGNPPAKLGDSQEFDLWCNG